jgi:hypothetical protein
VLGKFKPRNLYDRAMSTAWKRFPSHRIRDEELSWKPDPRELDNVLLRWPVKYQWEFRKYLGDQLRAAFHRFVRIEETDVPQNHDGVITFEFVYGDRTRRINIETSDYPPLNEKAYADCDLHFKQQYAKAGYGPRDHLLPGNFMGGASEIYHYLDRLRALRDSGEDRFEVAGRFELNMKERGGPIAQLAASTRFQFHGGQGKVPYIRYVREIARTAVSINLPSSANLTFRIFDYFAIGACIVGPPHTATLPVPFTEGEHLIYCKEDYSDLEDVCLRLLGQPAERKRLIANSRRFFDQYMHRDQAAAYQLDACLKRFSSDQSHPRA